MRLSCRRTPSEGTLRALLTRADALALRTPSPLLVPRVDRELAAAGQTELPEHPGRAQRGDRAPLSTAGRCEAAYSTKKESSA